MKRLYYAKSKIHNDDIIFCTFDTETDGLGGKLLCTTYSSILGTDILLGENSIVDWFDNVFLNLPLPAIHYAHFAQYDWRYLIPEILGRKFDKVEFNLRTGTDIYQIKIKIGKKWYVMRDSYAIYPAGLSDFSKQFSPELQKLTLDFEKTTFDINNPEHIEYAKRDAEALRHSLINYNSAIQKLFNVSIGHTVAGTAVKAWQKTLPDETIIHYSTDGERENFIRGAYYGGIVFLTTNEQLENCRTFDINSSYPDVMQKYPMPIGSPSRTNKYEPNAPAIYQVDIETPDNLIIPILPCRNKRGHMQWRSGRFITSITNFELEFALKHGYILHKIIDGLIWDNTINPFYDFVEICKSIRKAHKDTSYEKVAKLMQNSCYGKFGAKREKNSIVLGSENLKDDAKAQILSIDFDDVFVVSEYSEEMPCKPEWAVFITAYARLRLISTAYAVGPENVVYGDTDSLIVKADADISKIDIGAEYGQFKLEKTWLKFRAIAPKTYAGMLENGKWSGAGKGLNKKKMSQAKYKELYEQGETVVEYQTLPSLVVALKTEIAPAKMASRRSSEIKNSANYDLQNGRIKIKSMHGSDNQISNPNKSASRRAA